MASPCLCPAATVQAPVPKMKSCHVPKSPQGACLSCGVMNTPTSGTPVCAQLLKPPFWVLRTSQNFEQFHFPSMSCVSSTIKAEHTKLCTIKSFPPPFSLLFDTPIPGLSTQKRVILHILNSQKPAEAVVPRRAKRQGDGTCGWFSALQRAQKSAAALGAPSNEPWDHCTH